MNELEEVEIIHEDDFHIKPANENFAALFSWRVPRRVFEGYVVFRSLKEALGKRIVRKYGTCKKHGKTLLVEGKCFFCYIRQYL